MHIDQSVNYTKSIQNKLVERTVIQNIFQMYHPNNVNHRTYENNNML